MSSGKPTAGRYLLCATIFICIAIVGVGIGLGIYIQSISARFCKDNPDRLSQNQITCPPTVTTTKISITTPSGKFVSPSTEGSYRFGAIASDAGICATIGTNILAKRCGSAVDAAIAALLCQCVQNLQSCGIGGGHFMTIYNKQNNTVHTIDAREIAPAAASETMYVPPDKSSTEGGLSIGIPGEIKGLRKAWDIGGTLPWKDLFEPTIKLCRDGMPVQPALAIAIDKTKPFFTRNENLRKLLTNPKTGDFYKAGETMKLSKLADTLEVIANEGPDAFYNGSLTADIVADIQEAGGIITGQDLNYYRVALKDPLVVTLNDNSKVYTLPPPSGGAVLQMVMSIANEYGFSKDSISTTEKSILTWHRIIEMFKFAFAKRTSLGDGEVEDQSFRDELNSLVRNMTSESYAKYVKSMITDDKTHNYTYYGPTFYDVTEQGTAHLSVLAPNGDAVSVTSTINLYFGSKVVGTKTGIVFNNEMDDFSTPNTTNYYGVPASEANFIKPGKRPLSSMSPIIVVDKDGMVRLVIGASGGTKITTALALVAIETLWFGKGIKEAIDHRRLHHQLIPTHIIAEKGFPQDILEGLRSKGHDIQMSESAGSVVQGILQRNEGHVTANSDFRKGGYTDGY